MSGLRLQWKTKKLCAVAHLALLGVKRQEPAFWIYIFFLAVFSLALIIVIAASEELGTQLARLVNPLSKSNPITVSYVKNVVKIIGATDSVYKDYFKDGSDESVVSREEFDEI